MVKAHRLITLSVVSHGQNALVNKLLGDISRVCMDQVKLVLTQNAPDPVPFATTSLSCPVEIIKNNRAKGFGANHNASFQCCDTPYFCVCNPDIHLPSNPFPLLLEALTDTSTAVASPKVVDPNGSIEDSARHFPTAWSLLKKAFKDQRAPDYPTDGGIQKVDWCAGMFMLYQSDAYHAISGFDEAYFLYYEDVDICRRFKMADKSVVFVPQAMVVHDARRESRYRPLHMLHHFTSTMRFLARY